MDELTKTKAIGTEEFVKLEIKQEKLEKEDNTNKRAQTQEGSDISEMEDESCDVNETADKEDTPGHEEESHDKENMESKSNDNDQSFTTKLFNSFPVEMLPEIHNKTKLNFNNLGNPYIEWCKSKAGAKRIISKIQCLICSKSYTRERFGRRLTGNYKEHYERHVAEVQKCECKEEFKSVAQKQFHISTFHDGLFGCNKCLRVFKSEEKLKKHLPDHALTFQCDQCDFMSKNGTNGRYRLKKHIAWKHGESNPESERTLHVCKICTEKEGETKLFPAAHKLKRHMEKVHSPKSCPECGIVVHILDLHMANIHKSDAEKKYQCSECGKGFQFQYKLQNHSLSQHSGVLLKCRYLECERLYKDPSNRTAHERKTHGRIWSKNTDERKGTGN